MSEFQPSAEQILLRENDKLAFRNLQYIFSNKNLGLSGRTFASDITLNVSDALAICSTTLTLTLAPANSWSNRAQIKTPIILVVVTSGTVTLAASGADTIVGSTTLVGVTNVSLLSDGVSTWYVMGATALTYKQQTFTSGSGNFTWPTGVNVAYITMIAGGGGGGGNSSSAGVQAGSGGAGEFLLRYPIYRNGVSTSAYVVGTGGTGGTTAPTNGSTGIASTFSSLIVLPGSGGVASTGTASNGGAGGGLTAGAGGAGTGNGARGTVNSIYWFGGNGGNANLTTALNAIGFNYTVTSTGGAASQFGPGGATNGGNAATTSYGAGGTGGGLGGVAKAGGNGAGGIIIVEYYA